jgi:predicted alpha/beta hydrolase family esterase
MSTSVVFVQGGGGGAHAEDARLAESLAEALGEGFAVDYPCMPDEGEPDAARWAPVIADAIARAAAASDGPIVLVGHSIGGYVLVKQLAEAPPDVALAAVALIAAPFPSADPDWVFEGFDLPDDLGDRLAGIPVVLYASEDDQIVPFAHRERYARALPHALKRTTTGGHQLDDDLRVVADDIRRLIGGDRPA